MARLALEPQRKQNATRLCQRPMTEQFNHLVSLSACEEGNSTGKQTFSNQWAKNA